MYFLCLLADPPRDDGGSEVTKYIVELDDGKGRSPELLITVKLLKDWTLNTFAAFILP